MRVRSSSLIISLTFAAACSGTSEQPKTTATTSAAARPPAAASAPAAATASMGLVAPTPQPSGDIDFKAALDLGQKPAAEPELRHGKVAVSADWPASLYATFDTPTGRAACTAALVGPQAMLTAAHCVPASGRVTFSYAGQSAPYIATCTRHTRYGSDASADYGLCKLDRPFAAPAGFQYETISTGSMDGIAGTTLVMTGYGCISDAVASQQTDGRYRIGANTIEETSNSAPPHTRDAAFYKGGENNNLFTKDDPNLANLCPGDSGGPAFRETGASAGQFTSRVIVGVNSRVFYTDASRTTYGSSLVSATGGPDFRIWAEDWAKNVARVSLCGIEGSIPNCRS